MLTQSQARQFMLLKHGLLGDYRFHGKQGALAFVRQAGCIQFDPINVCGRNAELTLQSRVKGFTKGMLDELLYADRELVDYPDKNLAIFPVEDWSYFERYRQVARQNAERYPEIRAFAAHARERIETIGPVCSDDLDCAGDIYWQSAIHWSAGTNGARAVLEQMYATGELIVHHKKGARKYYDLTEKHIPAAFRNAPEPLPNELEHQKWRILRRIGAVGLLWNKPSDAWLNIWNLRAAERDEAFRQLLEEGRIMELAVEGIKQPLYCRAEDGPLVEAVRQNPEHKPRCELIAPLDCMIWDRNLIRALFAFDYTWEIYTPAHKRKYGYYVLPLLFGERLIGRVDAVAEQKTKTLLVKNIWYEDGVKQTRKLQTAVDGCLKRFARFHGCVIAQPSEQD